MKRTDLNCGCIRRIYDDETQDIELCELHELNNPFECPVRAHCFCALGADRKTIKCCQCTTAVVYGEPFQFQPICRYSKTAEFDRLKEQKEELLQREREAFERPLLAEIDTLRLRVKILEEALWKIAHWREFARDTALYGPALDMRAYAGDALERAAIGEKSK